MDFKKGLIVKSKKTLHPIIYWDKKDVDIFYGFILTHSPNYKNNISLKEEHFLNEDSNGEKYPVRYDKSFFCIQKLIKKSEWGPYREVGQLSQQGVNFLESKVPADSHAIFWTEYLMQSD